MIEVQSFEHSTAGTYLELKDYADTNTIKCKIANIGEEIIPERYSYSGTPYFSYDTFMRYANGDHYARIYVEVEYKSKDLELETKTFNTAFGISEYITDLETLHHIMNIRSVAHYKKGMKLNEFVWRGILKFDQFGQTMFLSKQEFVENIPKYVLTRAVNIEAFNLYCKSWCGTFKQIPNEDDICPQCGRKWTIDDISDFVTVRDKDYNFIGYHKNCLEEHNNKLLLNEFKDVFSKVYTLHNLTFTSIPNEYCSCEHCSSWFIVSTPDGDIKIGWRKRVINIKWLDNYKMFTDDFESEKNITKGFSEYDKERYIHAWSIEKAIDYLSRAKNSITK